MTESFSNSVADPDPGPGALLTRDPGWVKIQIRDELTASYSESLETIFRLKFFDPGSGNLSDPGSGIQDGKNSDPG